MPYLLQGGQGAASNHSLLLEKTPIQIIGAGLGEFIALDIATQYSQYIKTEDFSNIRGVYLKTSTGEIKFTGQMDPYRQLDMRVISHAFDFSAIPYRKYWAYNKLQYGGDALDHIKSSSMGYNSIRFYTELYCPFDCSFCIGKWLIGDVINGPQPAINLSPEEVIEIIERMLITYPELDTIYFNSDNFMLNRRYVYRVCQLIEERLKGKNLKFFALTRVDEVDPIILHRMYQVGFRMLTFGVEHTSGPVLKDIGKHIRLLNDRQHIEKAIRLAKSAGYEIPDVVMNRLKPYLETAGASLPIDEGHVIKRGLGESIETGFNTQASIVLFYPTISISDLKKTIDDVVELIEAGIVVDIFRYVEPYRGTNISKRGYPAITVDIKFGDELVALPHYIAPLDDKVREIAFRSCEVTTIKVVENAIRQYYGYKEEWTRTLDALALFWNIYYHASLPRESIEKTLTHIMVQMGTSAPSTKSTLTEIFESLYPAVTGNIETAAVSNIPEANLDVRGAI